jgi:protein-S-isoprenylcysteine O-methyltransferase Ste14
MRPFEAILAVVCAALAVRSAVHWLRRPLASTDPRDHALFALFLLARVGSWLFLAAWFAILATISDPVSGDLLQGRAAIDEIRSRYAWVAIGFFVAAGVALLASYFLAHRAPRDGAEAPPDDRV